MTEGLKRFLDKQMWAIVALSGSLDKQFEMMIKLGLQVTASEIEVIMGLRRVSVLIWQRADLGDTRRYEHCLSEGRKALKAMQTREGWKRNPASKPKKVMELRPVASSHPRRFEHLMASV